MPWQDPELDTDEAGIIERILLGMADRMPGWVPVEGAPEVALAEETGRETAATNALAVEALQLAIAGIGETIFGLAPRIGTAATLPVVSLAMMMSPEAAAPLDPTDTGTFDRVVSIPAGFTIATRDSHDGGLAYQTLVDVVETVTFDKITTGFLAGWYTGSLEVEMTCTVVGTVGNIDAGTEMTVITNTGIVSAVSVDEDGAGGLDEETLLEYLDRVTDYLSVLRPGAVRADGLAALARTVPGVHRAIGFDLLEPGNPVPQERTATIVAIDDEGQPVDGSVLTELTATLEAAREVNFNVFVADPTYTDVAVAATIVAAAGVDHTALDDLVTAAVAAYISPARWGNSSTAPRSWAETTTIQALDVAVVIAQVAGVASVTTVTVNGGATATLDEPAALPSPLEVGGSTVAVTVT